MKFINYILAFCLLTLVCSCSKPFYDSFTKNKEKWEVYSENTAKVEFNNGLIIEQMDDENSTFITRNFGNKPIRGIECSFKKFNGDIGVGIIWNFKDSKTHNRFIITTRDQQFYIQYKDSGKEDIKVNWKTNQAINKDDQINIFRMMQNGTYLKFYINDQLIYTENNSQFLLNNIGVMLGSSKGSRCKVNYFKTIK